MRYEDGAILVDGVQQFTTRQCAHCGSHEVCIPGSGVERGVCMKCMKFVCGKDVCRHACIPFAARLDHSAGKRTSYTEAILDEERILAAWHKQQQIRQPAP